MKFVSLVQVRIFDFSLKKILALLNFSFLFFFGGGGGKWSFSVSRYFEIVAVCLLAAQWRDVISSFVILSVSRHHKRDSGNHPHSTSVIMPFHWRIRLCQCTFFSTDLDCFVNRRRSLMLIYVNLC